MNQIRVVLSLCGDASDAPSACSGVRRRRFTEGLIQDQNTLQYGQIR
ncbi:MULTISPECIES: hypothetical protein [Methanothrix]|nr:MULTISPECIES: hypothetical protein [Methanothrix]